jgi:hypothetical protein
MDAVLDLAPLLSPSMYWLGECHLCGRTRTADRADVFRFLREAWPECCSHTMTFQTVFGEPPRAEPVE